ncbi:tetratricopeptide repeat protein [Elusimicrobiota bacterium]
MRGTSLISVLLTATLGASPLRAAESHVTPEMERQVRIGVDAVYKMDFDGAERAYERVRDLKPGHPYGYFGLALVTWMRYTYGTDQTDQELMAPFAERVGTAVSKGKAWIKAHPRDAEAHMALGATHGLRARLLVARREWIGAYLNGRRAIKYVRVAVKLDPELYDAYLGIGMYDYYTDLYPHFIRILARLLLRGNRKRGIETLRTVAEKGNYTRMTARLLLVEIYNHDPFGDQDPEKAIVMMREVRKLYPDSPMFHSAQLISLYHGKHFERVVAEASGFVKLASSGVYRPLDQAKGYSILGAAYWMLGREELALRAFDSGSRITLGDRLTRWAVWALIRAGNIHDLRGRREKAVELYRLALRQPDNWGFRSMAKRHISRPYRAEKDGFAVAPPR